MHQDMQLYKKAYLEWVARMQSERIPLIPYDCPNCKSEIQALKPLEDDLFDSDTVCPSCGLEHYRIVAPDAVTATIEEDVS